MYYIAFHDSKEVDIYSGDTYIFKGEKYACFDSLYPKLYKSEKIAENCAKKLIKSCANTGDSFEVCEWKGK